MKGKRPKPKAAVEQHEFALSGDFIQLDQLLKAVNLVSSGGEAHAAVDNGWVWVDGGLESRKRAKLRVGQKVSFQNHEVILVEARVSGQEAL